MADKHVKNTPYATNPTGTATGGGNDYSVLIASGTCPAAGSFGTIYIEDPGVGVYGMTLTLTGGTGFPDTATINADTGGSPYAIGVDNFDMVTDTDTTYTITSLTGYILVQASLGIDDAPNNYGIRLTGGTGANQRERILDYIDTGDAKGNYCVVIDRAWPTIAPDATSAYKIMVGSARNNGVGTGLHDGTDGAWDHPDCYSAGASADDIVHIAGTYTDADAGDATAIVDGDLRCIWRGFTTTPNDGGQATWDAGTNSLNFCITFVTAPIGAPMRIENIIMEGAVSHGANPSNADYVTFRNCIFRNNGGTGVNADERTTVEGCSSYGNTLQGINVDNGSVVYGCQVYDNGDDGILIESGWVSKTQVWGIAANKDGIHFDGSATTDPKAVDHCLVDNSEAAAGVDGVVFDTIYARPCLVTNSILYGYRGNGISVGGATLWTNRVSRNNIMKAGSGGTDYSNFATDEDEITVFASTDFAAYATHDYTPAAADSPQVGTAYPDGDIGPIQLTPTGGAGGGPIFTKRFVQGGVHPALATW